MGGAGDMAALRRFYASDTAELEVILGNDFRWRPWIYDAT